jgi:hypothetical protein
MARARGNEVGWNTATSRKVAGSIPNVPQPFSSTMALGSTQPLTEMSIKNLSGWGGKSKGLPERRADITAICDPLA